ILAVNHPTMFLEPCLLACFLPRQLHFLTRGDIFKHPVLDAILRSLNLIPIFRMKDGGFGQVKNNFNTLEYCFRALQENKVILIMAEGHCVQQKRLQSIKKGTARLAFGTYERFGDLDLHIVPVGVNYTYPDDFRSEVMFEFGPPIKVNEYHELYDTNPPKAIKSLTNEVAEHLRKLVIVIEDEADETVVEQHFTLYRNDHPEGILPVFSTDPKRLIAEKWIAEHFNQMPKMQKRKLKEETEAYFQCLDQHQVNDEAIAQKVDRHFDRTLILVMGFLPFLLGYVCNFLPLYGAEKVGEKVKDQEDRLSIVITTAMILYFVYYLLLLSLAAYMNHSYFWIFIAFVPMWGYFALLYRELYYKWKGNRKLNRLEPQLVGKLKNDRNKIVSWS
ncbi:MAG: 1-acyl-sn-glycerol-3-phosphate acyltransferase, partial [Bacteroidota bacterium]